MNEIQTITSTIESKRIAYILTPTNTIIDQVFRPMILLSMKMAIDLSKDIEFITAILKLKK